MIEQVFKTVLAELIKEHPNKWGEAPKNVKVGKKGVYFVLFAPEQSQKTLTVQHYDTTTLWIKYVEPLKNEKQLQSELYERFAGYSFGFITLNNDYRDEEDVAILQYRFDDFNKKYCCQLGNDLEEIVEKLELGYKFKSDD